MTDFETMPVGTAALLRDEAKWLREEHGKLLERHDTLVEKRDQAVGWRRASFEEGMTNYATRAEGVAERIGAIEALLDRCPAAAGADR